MREQRTYGSVRGATSDFEIGTKNVAMSRDTAGTSARATGGEQAWLRSHRDSSLAYGPELSIFLRYPHVTAWNYFSAARVVGGFVSSNQQVTITRFQCFPYFNPNIAF